MNRKSQTLEIEGLPPVINIPIKKKPRVFDDPEPTTEKEPNKKEDYPELPEQSNSLVALPSTAFKERDYNSSSVQTLILKLYTKL